MSHSEQLQSTSEELDACRDAKAAVEDRLEGAEVAGAALEQDKAQLAADLAAKQEALQAALSRCEAAEVQHVPCSYVHFWMPVFGSCLINVQSSWE